MTAQIAADAKPSVIESRVAKLEKRVQELEALVAKLTSKQPAVATPKIKGTRRAGSKDSPLILDDWSYSAAKGQYGQYHYDINLNLRNAGTKGIKLIEAAVMFNDLLDKKIYGIKVPPDIAIAPGTTFIKNGQFPINQFIADEARMAGMKKSDIKAKLVVQRIVFDDNTVLKVGR